MTRSNKLLGAVSSLALITLSSTQAIAAPPSAATAAGTTIQNKVSVSFKVGGEDQTPVESNTDKFVVDQKVNLTVTLTGGTVVVTPNGKSQVSKFEVTNKTNATTDFALSVTQADTDATGLSLTDSFDASNVRIYLDKNGDGAVDAGDTLLDATTPYIDELGADAIAKILVVVDIPADVVSDDVALFDLKAQAHKGGTADALGDVITTSETNGKMVVDYVLADGKSSDNITGDDDYDGIYAAYGAFTVEAAALTAVKSSTIISDPITTATGIGSPKAIPGAVIEYCIYVENDSGAKRSANNVVIEDAVPSDVTYDSTFGVVTQNSCSDTDGAGTGTYADGTASANFGTMDAGDAHAMIFRAVIN